MTASGASQTSVRQRDVHEKVAISFHGSAPAPKLAKATYAVGLTLETRSALPLSQAMLADSLGMTPVHLNRVMKELRSSEAMTLQRGSLIIEDPVKLIRIAGFDENYLHRRLRVAE